MSKVEQQSKQQQQQLNNNNNNNNKPVKNAEKTIWTLTSEVTNGAVMDAPPGRLQTKERHNEGLKCDGDQHDTHHTDQDPLETAHAANLGEKAINTESHCVDYELQTTGTSAIVEQAKGGGGESEKLAGPRT